MHLREKKAFSHFNGNHFLVDHSTFFCILNAWCVLVMSDDLKERGWTVDTSDRELCKQSTAFTVDILSPLLEQIFGKCSRIAQNIIIIKCLVNQLVDVLLTYTFQD